MFKKYECWILEIHQNLLTYLSINSLLVVYLKPALKHSSTIKTDGYVKSQILVLCHTEGSEKSFSII
jgi:hypothetical protein